MLTLVLKGHSKFVKPGGELHFNYADPSDTLKFFPKCATILYSLSVHSFNLSLGALQKFYVKFACLKSTIKTLEKEEKYEAAVRV